MSGAMRKSTGKGDVTPGTLGPCAAGWPGSQPSALGSMEQVTRDPRRPSRKPAHRGGSWAREETSFQGPAPVHQGRCLCHLLEPQSQPRFTAGSPTFPFKVTKPLSRRDRTGTQVCLNQRPCSSHMTYNPLLSPENHQPPRGACEAAATGHLSGRETPAVSSAGAGIGTDLPREGGLRSPTRPSPPVLAPPACCRVRVGGHAHLSFSFRHSCTCSSSMAVSMGRK